MKRGLLTFFLLLLSNAFMNYAWYGHLKYAGQGKNWPLWAIILISWGIALFEYILQVPANRLGFKENGGPFNLMQLKIVQEALGLLVFTLMTVFLFKNESLKLNHFIGFGFLLLAVYFIFKD